MSICSVALAEDVAPEYLDGKRGYADHDALCPCHEVVVLHACSACPRCLVHTHASKCICSILKCVFFGQSGARRTTHSQAQPSTPQILRTQQMNCFLDGRSSAGHMQRDTRTAGPDAAWAAWHLAAYMAERFVDGRRKTMMPGVFGSGASSNAGPPTLKRLAWCGMVNWID